MSTFTPGPWSYVDHSWACIGVYAHDTTRGVASLSIEDEVTEDDQYQLEVEMQANARLIAAAPELLAALIAMVDAHAVPSSGCKERPAYDAARAAIAKATGEPS